MFTRERIRNKAALVLVALLLVATAFVAAAGCKDDKADNTGLLLLLGAAASQTNQTSHFATIPPGVAQ